MLTLHHLETSRSQRVLWLLEELGIPYRLVTHRRDPATRLAPPALKAIHPMGKSPVIVDGDVTVAESGAIIEYLAETYGQAASQSLPGLVPAPGTAEHRRVRYWMHFAEGSAMNWLVMKLVFMTIPTQPMPFFVRPIARALCGNVLTRLVDPNVDAALKFMEAELAGRTWFAGDALTIADFQMSFAVEAGLSRGAGEATCPNLVRYRRQLHARPAYQRALAQGGPVLMGA